MPPLMDRAVRGVWNKNRSDSYVSSYTSTGPAAGDVRHGTTPHVNRGPMTTKAGHPTDSRPVLAASPICYPSGIATETLLVPRPHRALYAAFDRFPSRKGSGVHIARFSRALFDSAGGGLLYVLGGSDLPGWQMEGDVEIVRFFSRHRQFSPADGRIRREALGTTG